MLHVYLKSSCPILSERHNFYLYFLGSFKHPAIFSSAVNLHIIYTLRCLTDKIHLNGKINMYYH